MQEVAVVCTDDGDSILYLDVRTSAQVYAQKGCVCGGSNGCAFSRSHNTVIVAQRNKDAMLVGYPPKETCRLHHTVERLSCVAVSNDSVYLAAGTLQGRIMVWQLLTGELLRLYTAHYRAVRSVRFSLDTGFLISGSADSTIKAWNLADVLDSAQSSSTPTPHRVISDHHLAVNDLMSVALHPAWVLSCSADMTVKVIDVFEGVVIFSRPLPCPLTCVTSNSITTTAFAGGSDGKVYSVQLYPASVSSLRSDGLVQQSSHQQAKGWISNSLGASSSSNSDVTGFREYEGHKGSITGVALTVDDQWLISGSEDGTVNIFDIATTQLLRTLLTAKGRICALQVVLLPTSLPTERNLGMVHPLAPQIKKYPKTDFNSFLIGQPTAAVAKSPAEALQGKTVASNPKERRKLEKAKMKEARKTAAEGGVVLSSKEAKRQRTRERRQQRKMENRAKAQALKEEKERQAEEERQKQKELEKTQKTKDKLVRVRQERETARSDVEKLSAENQRLLALNNRLYSLLVAAKQGAGGGENEVGDEGMEGPTPRNTNEGPASQTQNGDDSVEED